MLWSVPRSTFPQSVLLIQQAKAWNQSTALLSCGFILEQFLRNHFHWILSQQKNGTRLNHLRRPTSLKIGRQPIIFLITKMVRHVTALPSSFQAKCHCKQTQFPTTCFLLDETVVRWRHNQVPVSCTVLLSLPSPPTLPSPFQTWTYQRQHYILW